MCHIPEKGCVVTSWLIVLGFDMAPAFSSDEQGEAFPKFQNISLACVSRRGIIESAHFLKQTTKQASNKTVDIYILSWMLIGRTDVEAEAPVLGSPDAKSWLFGKDPDAGKDWGQEEKGVTEDEMVGQHHWLNRHELMQTLGGSEGQGSRVCCSSWSHKELDMT